ncbi:MAG: hypothetical protein AAFN74_09340 [Myxococcota bacterium]
MPRTTGARRARTYLRHRRAFGIGSVIVCVSCASPSAPAPAAAVTTTVVPLNAPDWVSKSSYVEGRKIYGIGVVAGIRNRGLAMSTAGNRARAEISKLTQTYTASLMKQYARSTSAGDLSASSEEQSVELVVKTFSRQLQVGVQITGFFFDDAQNIVYARAELDLDKQAAIRAAQSRIGNDFAEWYRVHKDDALDALKRQPKP